VRRHSRLHLHRRAAAPHPPRVVPSPSARMELLVCKPNCPNPCRALTLRAGASSSSAAAYTPQPTPRTLSSQRSRRTSPPPHPPRCCPACACWTNTLAT
jgi:hypothetical protein